LFALLEKARYINLAILEVSNRKPMPVPGRKSVAGVHSATAVVNSF
jgi:hypothetical protein